MSCLQNTWIKIFHFRLHSAILLLYQISAILLTLVTQAIVMVDTKKTLQIQKEGEKHYMWD